MSKRTYGAYATLKEARAAAREQATTYSVVPVYEEPDGSYSIEYPFHKKATLACGIDKSGRRYKLAWVRDYVGQKVQRFQPIKSQKEKDK